MNLPMPNDEFDGGTVVASAWTKDDDGEMWYTLLLLMPVTPFYAVSHYENGVYVGGEVFENIVFASHYYREETGCV